MHGAILLCQVTTGLQLANLAKEKKMPLALHCVEEAAVAGRIYALGKGDEEKVGIRSHY